METKEMIQNLQKWNNSEWFLEWERLALHDYLGERCGYWCYDKETKIYKYIKLL